MRAGAHGTHVASNTLKADSTSQMNYTFITEVFCEHDGKMHILTCQFWILLFEKEKHPLFNIFCRFSIPVKLYVTLV